MAFSAPSLAVFAVVLSVAVSLPAEDKLYRDLLKNYNKLSRPISDPSELIKLNLGLYLLSYDIDSAKDEITQQIWVQYAWSDPRLVWDPQEYAGIDSIRLMPDQLWMPDIMPYTTLPKAELDWLEPVPVVVKSDGSLLSVAPASVRSRCTRPKVWTDELQCELKVGSWTYSGYVLDLVEPTLDLTELVANAEWELMDHTIKRNEKVYPCCPEPYIDVTATLYLRRSKHPAGCPAESAESGVKESGWKGEPISKV